jgi:hypothetical protein
VKGFGLWMKSSRVRSHVLKYRLGSRTRRRTIGNTDRFGRPRRLGIERWDFLRSVRDGRDPATEKSENREGLTLGVLANLYLGEGMTG